MCRAWVEVVHPSPKDVVAPPSKRRAHTTGQVDQSIRVFREGAIGEASFWPVESATFKRPLFVVAERETSWEHRAKRAEVLVGRVVLSKTSVGEGQSWLGCAVVGQPVILAGDFKADPVIIPSLAKGISDGRWIDLERAFCLGSWCSSFLYLSIPT